MPVAFMLTTFPKSTATPRCDRSNESPLTDVISHAEWIL